jgi:hypothetical protein
MMRKYFLLPLCLLSAVLFSDIAFAQTENREDIPVPVRKKRPKPIKHELSGGLRVSSDGWNLFLDRGKIKQPDRTTDYHYNLQFWQLEFGEKKHPQEIKRSNTIGTTADAAKPFIYGKANNFYALKVGYGKRKLIAGKPELNDEVERGVISVHWVYLGGVSIGLEKPYYIEAYVNNNGISELKSITYTDSTKADFLFQPNVVGSSGFGKGLGETKIVPGIHAKTGLHFDFAATKKSKLAVETGLALEIYSRGIQLMAVEKTTPVFVNVYASFQIGKRWAEKK